MGPAGYKLFIYIYIFKLVSMLFLGKGLGKGIMNWAVKIAHLIYKLYNHNVSNYTFVTVIFYSLTYISCFLL